MLRINTFGIVVGGYKCNAKCPYCISRMTFKKNSEVIDWTRFEKAKKLALRLGAYESLLTGVGEPTLYPEIISQILERLNNEFPIVTLQTNGILLHSMPLETWKRLGLTIISISTVHWERKKNEEIFNTNYPELPSLIKQIHKNGLSVRLSAVLVNGYLDSVKSVLKMIEFAKEQEVEQLTFGFVESAGNEFVKKYEISEKRKETILKYLVKIGDEVYKFPGGIVLDIDGQNVCLRNCMENKENNDFRTLIFARNHVYLSWDKKGSVLF